jgi:hypothetical protein
MLFLDVVLFGIGCIVYRFWRHLVVGVIGVGGHPAMILFKPSFIEGQSINAAAAEEVGPIIREVMDSRS